MLPKSFLLAECKNVNSVLSETLRYKYGPEGSSQFYEECGTRLKFLEEQIGLTDDLDFSSLEDWGDQLEQLSGLISRIERSAIGEYSWPFVEELKKISASICAENTLESNDNPPKVHVLSDGGLGAYRIYPERKRPSVSRCRILTIVFPRTLKDFVLLHPILGHELGHAMWQGSKHQTQLRTILSTKLLPGSILQTDDALLTWLYSDAAPDGTKEQLDYLRMRRGIVKENFFQHFASSGAWIEEILCDFIGLLTFGPSFVAALCRLLYALNPSGSGFGPQHPPVGCRVNLMLKAATMLKDDQAFAGQPKLEAAREKFWSDLNKQVKADKWYELFDTKNIQDTLDDLGTLIASCSHARYQQPTVAEIGPLFELLADCIPPVGFEFDAQNKPAIRTVDFRHILYAGWIANHLESSVSFGDLNRLCQHGLMQQAGIKQYLGQGAT